MAISNPIEIFGDLGLKADNFKCFQDYQGFDCFKPINIIIGKNNAGKSTLLDLLDYAIRAVHPNDVPGYRGNIAKFALYTKGASGLFKKFVTDNVSMNGVSHRAFACRHLDGVSFKLSINGSSNLKDDAREMLQEMPELLARYQGQALEVVYQVMLGIKNPLSEYRFRRLFADRDIRPESTSNPSSGLEVLGFDGEHATRLIQRYLNQSDLDESIVEDVITGELNRVFRPDSVIERIVAQQRMNGDWELYLDEPSKGRVPLSRTGSGMKTILLVLLNLYLVPNSLVRTPTSSGFTAATSIPLSDFIFAFEELENNLHPSLQRRLFLYLRDIAKRERCRFFITTHSHIVIDLFSRDEDAQIIHVTHDGTSAKATRVMTFLNRRSVFDDLEVRASDLLQTNAVVWVEGPSDRIYFNKWVELWTNGELKEHVDYEVVFSAGSLLAHYDFGDPVSDDERIQALKINKNAIILIDSDKRTDDTPLKARADRVIEEVVRAGGIAWLTFGKEVENYIPPARLSGLVGTPALPLDDRFANIFDYLKENGAGDFSGRKADLAERVCKSLTLEMIVGHMDLAEKLELVCRRIREWNHRPQPGT